MEFDFSRVNLHYLLQARDLARQHPERAQALLGTPLHFATLLAEIPAEVLVTVTGIRAPLLVPRQTGWWWLRFLEAIGRVQPGELDSLVEHGLLASLSWQR